MKVAQVITDVIIKKLEEGVIPWRKPWSGKSSTAAPRNLVSRKPYRGINVFLLAAQGFSSPWWLTFKQIQEKSGQLRKGSKGCPVVFWSTVEVEDEEGTERAIPFMRYYTVFNLEQVDGITSPTLEEIEEAEREFSPIEEAEAIIANMPQRPEIRHAGNRACYQPFFDVVTMPERENFYSDEEYYSTLFHELAHSTGHASRVGRKGIEEPSFFGSHEYSREELVAEMTAAFLAAEAGIEAATIDNSAAYIQSWLRALKSRDNAGMVIQAASQAQKAYDFILDRRPEQIQAAA